jgi:membrane protein YdbS with pleckstrin-like domain
MLAQFERLKVMAAEDFDRYKKEKVRAVALYAVAAVLGLTAYACAVTALVVWLARGGDPVMAAAAAAAGFAVLALILIGIVALMKRAEEKRRAKRAEVYAATMRSAAGTIMLGMAMRPRTLAAGVAVLVAGVALGVLRSSGRSDDA